MSTNVLISSAGRRVNLLELFRESLRDLRLNGRVLAVDATRYSAAGEMADEFFIVPRCSDPSFIPQLLEICSVERIALVVPTIDTELAAYAAARHLFEQIGTTVAVSDPTTIALCEDKVATHRWLSQNGFPTPRQSSPALVLADPHSWEFPVIVKPRKGSASSGLQIISHLKDLEAIAEDSTMILQEYVRGNEFTVNCFVDRKGQCITAIPHQRLETRGGEVSKGVTVRDESMIVLIKSLVQALPGAFGALNVQCFLTPEKEIRIIEINARFGGGYPLAHRAGCTITRWLLEDILALDLTGPFNEWQEGLVMLRYDQPVFVEPGKSHYRMLENATTVHNL